MSDRTLTIRYTSDTHGYLFATDYTDRLERPMGLMKLAGEYPHDANTLILDGGDTIEGSPLCTYWHRVMSERERDGAPASRLLETNPFAAMMNLAGYQYVTLGNHDFNYGITALEQYLSQLHAVCLCCNIRDKADRLPIRPYAVHTLQNGLRVGLVGACTHYVSRWEDPKTLAQLIIEEPIPAAARALRAVKPLCDVTVLLYHGGFECDLQTGALLSDSEENQACRICRELTFDLVLTGHQHMAVAGRRFGNSYVVQPAYRALHACAVTLSVGSDGRKRFQSTLQSACGAPLPEATALLAPLEARVQQWLDEPVGHLDRALPAGDHLDMALHGSLLANFINTVIKDASGAQVAACALANEVHGLPEHVSVRDVVSAYIYSNTLIVLRLSGTTLRRYVERAAAYLALDAHGMPCISDEFLKPKVQHYNYEFFLGMDYVIDLRRPVGSRVVSMKLDSREIEPEETVTVCVSSYRACGTGGYDMLVGQSVERDIPRDVADMITCYILDHADIRVDTNRYCTVLY